MKPKTGHWADQAATRVIGSCGDKAAYVVASGITPSGLVHVGNFREAITCDLVGRALKDLGKKVRAIHSWDDFDTFRKIPSHLPNGEEFKQYLFQPISRIPDPWGKAKSYAEAHTKLFEDELATIGMHPEFIYQQKKYSSGDYATQIKQALQKTKEIKAILDQHRTTPLPDTWLPTSIYCSQCQSDKMVSQSYDGAWGYQYHCECCGHRETVDIRKTPNLKLSWRVDWPMRWAFEQVDFEPGGKDHSSQGGSYDTAKDIVKAVWGHAAPVYLQYDMVGIKGGVGKMSSSTGKLYTLNQVYEVYDPQMIRWIFASHRPNHDFSLAFDEDVIKCYEEFDRAEQGFFHPPSTVNKKTEVNRRAFELSLLDSDPKPVYRPSFRELCNRLQICDGDIQRTKDRYYTASLSSHEDHRAFDLRAKRAWNWIQNHAPEEFCYRLHRDKQNFTWSEDEQAALTKFRLLIAHLDFTSLSAADLNQKIYDEVIRGANVEAKSFFRLVYQSLIGRDQGPRLAGFLKEVGATKVLELL